ncbi:MAG: hypothetical protein ACK4HF_07825 [Paracoccaceae bacterium]
MKPSFSLDLTEDGITLLHRTSRGWVDVGTVAFDDPDMGAALEYLRSTALGLSPTGIATKLIIPESQILYLQVDAAGPDDTSRRAQIEAALDGRTPYALDELAYDWAGSGPTVTVAVVARETLAEAEAFAAEHRFNPVAFVARPEGGFDKEPFFGPSSLAPSLLADGEQVEADAAPVTIIARGMSRPDDAVATGVAVAPDHPAEPGFADPAAPAPEAPSPDLPEPAAPAPGAPAPDMPEPAPKPEVPDPEVPAPSPPLQEPPAPEPDLPEPSVELPPAGPAAAAGPAPEDAAPVSDTTTPPGPEPTVVPAPAQPAFDRPRSPPSMTAPVLTRTLAEEAEAPMAVDVPQEDANDVGTAKPASVLSERPPEDDLPPPMSSAAQMAFSARRPLGGSNPAVSRPEAVGTRPAAPSATRPSGSVPAATKPVVERPAAARPAPKFSYDDPLPPPPRMPGDPPTPPASVMGKAGKGLRSLGSMVTAPSIPGTRKKKPAVNGAAPAAAGLIKPAVAAATLAPASTLAAPLDASPVTASVKAASQSLARQNTVSPDAIAKGLSARTMPQRGKPRYLGLILTGILLLILAIVAAWSSYYLTRSDDPVADVQVAGFDGSVEGGLDDEAIADGQLPATEADPLAGLPLADLPVDVDLGEAEVAATVDVPEAVAVAEEPPAPPIVEPAPQTGVQDVLAAATQPDPANQDEIFLAGMDAPPSLSDPLVLPPPAASGDAPPAAQMAPPPFGTVYQFDADGRIIPTPGGIETPEGVMLFAGKPTRVPPPRPAAVEAAAVAAATPDATADAAAAAITEAVAEAAAPVADRDLLPAETFAADPALSGARPRVRPEGLAPEAASDEDASLAPAEGSRFASLRPRLRPPAILAAGEAARRASEAASLAVQVAVAEAAVASAADASLSPLAVSVSRVPAPRPRDLSRAVEAAVAAATRRAEPEVVAAAAPAPRAATPQVQEDEADDEPEVASAAPRIPTRANVAKQATFVNAINLSKINLIGVYGTQSKRYALVRQPNGRYRKVRVGDNIDGGRVQAITASEVRYQKGGRMMSLAMPKG